MRECQRRLAGLDVPELDGEVARGGGEDVFGGRVEENLSYFPGWASVLEAQTNAES